MHGPLAAAFGYAARMTITGSLSKSAAPSGNIVTSDAVTVTVPAGSDGKLESYSQSDTGTVTLEFRKNAGAWGGLSGATVFANTDTLTARITSAIAGESSTFSIREVTSGAYVAGPFTVAAV